VNKKVKKNIIIHKKKINYLLFLIVIPVFFIILFSTLYSQLYNLNYYDKKYELYNVYETFEKDIAINKTNNLLNYFKSKNELDSTFFNEDEISHLNDVRNLLNTTRQIYYLSMTIFWITLIIIYLINKQNISDFFFKVLFVSGIFTISFFVLFGLYYLAYGFDNLFLKFHELLFIGNYSFDPTISNMKALFSDEFFRDFTLIVVFKTVMKSIFMIITGYYFIKKS